VRKILAGLIISIAVSAAYAPAAYADRSEHWCEKHEGDRFVPVLREKYWLSCNEYMRRRHEDEYRRWRDEQHSGRDYHGDRGYDNGSRWRGGYGGGGMGYGY